jgi:hypothetical protein
MSHADKLTLIILAALATVMLLAMIRLPAAIVISALFWLAVWKVGAL